MLTVCDAQIWVVPRQAELRDEIFIFSGRTRTLQVKTSRSKATITVKIGSEWLLNDFWRLQGPFNADFVTGEPSHIAHTYPRATP